MDHSSEEPLTRTGNTDSESREEQRKRYRWTNNIELPIFLMMFAVTLSDTAKTNIIMYRTCIHTLGYPVSECRPFLKPGQANISSETEANVQEYATFVTMVKSILESLLPAVLSLFMIVWSDRHGRKPLIVWPMLGITLTSILEVLFGMVQMLGPWWYIPTSVPYSLTGGFSILATAAMCYITDLTTEKNRSLRMMFVQAIFAAGIMTGSLASSYLMRQVGTVYLLLISAVVTTFAYAFAVICIEESIEGAVPGSLATILDRSLITNMFKECFKRRPNRMRSQILVLTTANSLNSFAVYGVSGLGYLYVRNVLQWSLEDYTGFAAVTTAITFVGSLLGVAVIQRLFKIGDLPFTMFAYLSIAAAYSIRGLATLTWHMYLASSVAIFGDMPSALLRAFVSKIVPAEDVAKVFALMCAIEGLCPVLAPLVFNALYAMTISSYPGAIMFITSDINLICVFLLGVVAFIRWRANSSQITQYAAVLEQGDDDR